MRAGYLTIVAALLLTDDFSIIVISMKKYSQSGGITDGKGLWLCACVEPGAK